MRRELLPMLKLAGPVILAEIGWMSMGIVDTIMVGPLGPAAIGASGMSNSIFFAVAVFGMGVMLGLDALVATSYGAGRLDDCVRWLQHGILVALVVAPTIMLVFYGALTTSTHWGLHPSVRAQAQPYMAILGLGAVPLLLYATFRRYLQGIHAVRPVMVALVTANLVNVFGNWVLIWGHLGVPAFGINGSAWATVGARVYMAAFLGLAIVREHRRRGATHTPVPFAFDAARARRLLALGVPAASQVTLEVGVFAAVSALAGTLDPVSLGAHQIALNIAALAFMVPLGLASAAAVRVGHAVGAADGRRAVQAGWTALAVGAIITGSIGVLLIVTPTPMLRVFTDDPQLLSIGVRLLSIAAVFQLFDGTQAVATGVLRGVGDTRTPMAVNVVGHWAFGLPVGWWLCFRRGWGVAGLWVGLSIGLIFVATVLTVAWHRESRRFILPRAVAPAVQ
ncbi:MAG TPA: MATE family efflux transporter [Vicinamibacterales bacterium]|jgi:MATE family, multidrug efflux pump|nr:MATE family efflux transporter [Vicinamibacterales bacterium]